MFKKTIIRIFAAKKRAAVHAFALTQVLVSHHFESNPLGHTIQCKALCNIYRRASLKHNFSPELSFLQRLFFHRHFGKICQMLGFSVRWENIFDQNIQFLSNEDELFLSIQARIFEFLSLQTTIFTLQ